MGPHKLFHVCGRDAGTQEATTLRQVNLQAGPDLFETGRRGVGRSGSGASRAPTPPTTPPDKPGWPHGGGQGCRRVSSGTHTLSARGDNQQGATGQPTRWSALHLVHSAGSHSIGPCLRALAGNTMQGWSWSWWWRRRAAAGGAIHGAILISQSLVIVKGPRAGNILRIFLFSIQVPVDH